MTGSQRDLVRADMTFFETERGGAVFSAGSIAQRGRCEYHPADELQRFGLACPVPGGNRVMARIAVEPGLGFELDEA